MTRCDSERVATMQKPDLNGPGGQPRAFPSPHLFRAALLFGFFVVSACGNPPSVRGGPTSAVASGFPAAPTLDTLQTHRLEVGDTLVYEGFLQPVLLADSGRDELMRIEDNRLFRLRDTVRLSILGPVAPKPVLALLFQRGTNYCKEEQVLVATPIGERYLIAFRLPIWVADRVTHMGMIRVEDQHLLHIGTDQCSGSAGRWEDLLYRVDANGEFAEVPIELQDDPRLRAAFTPAVQWLFGGPDFHDDRARFVLCGMLADGKNFEGILRGTLKLEDRFVSERESAFRSSFRLVADTFFRDDDYPGSCGSPRTGTQ
jgi:hypothetical protein